MVGEPLVRPVSRSGFEALDGLDDAGVRGPCRRSGSKVAVRDLVGERVLEGVLGIGRHARLVQELGGLQAVEPAAHCLVREIGDGLEQRSRHVLSDDGGDLEEVPVLAPGSRSIRAPPASAWTVGGTAIASTGCASRYRPRSPASTLVSTSIRTDLFQEERVALSDQSCLRGSSRDRGRAARPSSSRRSRPAARPGPPGCRSVLLAPGVPILRPIGHEQKHSRGRHAVDEAVENLLGLGVDPVKILDDQAQQRRPARGQEHLPDGIARPLAALRRIRIAGTDGPAARRRADRVREAGQREASASAGNARVTRSRLRRRHPRAGCGTGP